MTDCAKRQVPCQYCDMMLAYSELAGHEDYCGSRTEPCVTCGRYVMVREADIHRQTNCEYPDITQKNESEPSASGFSWTREHNFHDHFSDPFGYSMLHDHFPQRMREMLENHHGNLSDLEDVFGQMTFRQTRFGDSELEDPFIGVRLRSPVDDPPPPYLYDNNADDTHTNDTRVFPEEHMTLLDHISVGSDNNDDSDDEGKSFSLLF